jgi:hypothetical protein
MYGLILFVLNVLGAIVKLFGGSQGARVLMVDDPRQDLAKLPRVQLRRFPVALNEAALEGNEFIDERFSQRFIERRRQFGNQSGSLDQGHF